MSESFRYDATFYYNILVVGQRACGKTGFVQSLGKTSMFSAGVKSIDYQE